MDTANTQLVYQQTQWITRWQVVDRLWTTQPRYVMLSLTQRVESEGLYEICCVNYCCDYRYDFPGTGRVTQPLRRLQGHLQTHLQVGLWWLQAEMLPSQTLRAGLQEQVQTQGPVLRRMLRRPLDRRLQ